MTWDNLDKVIDATERGLTSVEQQKEEKEEDPLMITSDDSIDSEDRLANQEKFEAWASIANIDQLQMFHEIETRLNADV
eukprot:CAMPEP_0206216154 /NCGR_PEP_ID=MMETSP0047_2-20121206/2572_1 /ASSEMBLY_ACC=CAM_ASM_000192 /TAXON_ID=195065 /ORGANISM="Chroomonas mesostigmatica_cf, Strain CCMP1168" /LENGTH=78 /DNA_ID=CAMNT_0053638487 /DNA_START=36 /DNA_END=272 /DNA_ORIENTATION=+